MPGFIPFKELAERVDVAQVAQHLGLQIKGKDNRSSCPACQSDNERALQLFPETNSFRCYTASVSGDCIALLAHVKGTGMYAAAKQLGELFGTPTSGRNTSPTTPQKPEGRTAQAQPAPFDPDKFAKNLVYSDEVAALDISEEDALRLGIGWHPKRKAVYFPIRNPDGTVSGFIGSQQSQLKLPPQWLPSKVVRLRRA
jgi:CHC2 zinc finger